MKTRTKETCKSFKRDFIGDYQSAKINCKIYDKIAILELVSKVACGWNWSKFQSFCFYIMLIVIVVVIQGAIKWKLGMA